MGVHGLTSFIAKQSSLHHTLSLPSSSSSTPPPPPPPPRPFIVDAMAFLYYIGLQDTLRGGNYHQLKENGVRRHVEYWRACGLEPEFVWDGPFDASKLPTVVQRSSQSLKKSLAYMRASDEKRLSQPQLAASASRLPMLSQNACLAEMRALGVKMWFAEGEADSPTAELAQRRGEGALVGSNDSDYFIFPTTAGYVPLQRIEYGPDRLPRLEHVDPSLPPCMRLQVNHHTTIAKSLSIPPSHLPVFAALIGNDQFSYPELLLPRRTAPAFPGQVDKTDTWRIARALSQVDASIGVEGALRSVVPTLLQPGKPARDANMLPNLLRSANSYLLQPLGLPSPSFPLHPQANDTIPQAQCRQAYLASFRQGHLNQFTLSLIKHREVTPGGAVEVTEFQSPSVAIGRPLRLWIYAILEEGIGFAGATSIIEHVRRQEELHAATVPIPKLQDLLDRRGAGVFPSPAVLGSEEERMALYLTAMGWDGPPPTAMSNPFLPLILALRHVQRYTKRPWSRSELIAALSTAVFLSSSSSSPLPSLPPPNPPPRSSIQRSVELLQALFYQHLLAEVLLLTTAGRLGEPHALFDGAMLHALLEVGEGLEGRLEVGVGRVVRGLVELVES